MTARILAALVVAFLVILAAPLAIALGPGAVILLAGAVWALFALQHGRARRALLVIGAAVVLAILQYLRTRKETHHE